MLIHRIIFYLGLAFLYLFLFRREISLMCKVLQKVSTGSVWMAMFSLLVFVDLLPYTGNLTFRIVNFIFYIGFLWVIYKMIGLGWSRTLHTLCRLPSVLFIAYAFVCLGSAIFASQIPEVSIDWNIHHAFRLLIFFISIPLLAYRDQKNVLSVKIVYTLLGVLALRTCLPYFEAFFSDSIMPWDWINVTVEDKFKWYRWSLTNWGWNLGESLTSSFGKDANGLGMMVNSYAYIVALMLLMCLNMMFGKYFDSRFIFPVVVFCITVFHIGSQTAYLIVMIGVFLIAIIKLRKWSFVFIVFGVFLVFNNKDVLLKFATDGWFSLVLYVQSDFRLNKLFPSGIEGFLEKPLFGYGFPSGEYIFFQNNGFAANIIEAHNTLISVLLNTGIIGLIPFTMGFVSIMYILIKYTLDSQCKLLAINLLILAASSFIASFFLTDFFYKFDDILMTRMYPFFIILLASQIIHNENILKIKK